MQSRYENLVLRKPAPPAHEIKPENVPEDEFTPTGVKVLCDAGIFPQAGSIVEYAFITTDTSLGNRPGGPQPHKHDYAELLMYLGTDPDNPEDLGGEIEMWLGEDEKLDKLTLTTSSSIFIPPGLAHLLLFYRNVRRPIMHVLVMFDSTDYDFMPVSREGRLLTD